MLRFGVLHLLVAVTFLIDLQQCAKGDSPPAPPIDAHGDPLPAHAVARLGPARFRHAGNPWDVKYSPDGKLMASWVDRPEGIYVWDAQTGKALYRFTPPEHALYPKVAFSPDSKYLGGYGSVWDLKTGKESLNLGGDFRAFSGDGRRVAALDWRTTHVWDWPNRKKEREIPGQFLALSKDGKRLTTLVEKSVVVWDTETGKELQKLVGTFVNHFAGQIIAYSDQKDLRLYDTVTGKETVRLPQIISLEDRQPYPRNSFSGDGKLFAGFEWDANVFEKASIWDTQSGKRVCQLVAPRRQVFSGIVMSPDGKTVTTLNAGAGLSTALFVHVWDVATGKQLHGRIQGALVGYSPDSKRIASIDGHAIRVWDAATGEERTPVSGPTGSVQCVSFSADGSTVVAGYDNVDAGTFRTWDVASGKVRRTFKTHFERNLSGLKHKLAVFAPTGKKLYAVQSHRLLALDGSTGNSGVFGDVGDWAVRWLSIGPDDYNITALEMRQVNKNDLSIDRPNSNAVFRFLDGSTGRDLAEKDRPRFARALQRLAPEQGPNTIAFAISTDFRLMAWVRLDSWGNGEAKGLRLREIATGKDLAAIGPVGEIRGLALSPDGRLLALVTADGRLRFWDVAANKEIASWSNSDGIPTCVSFSPDGKSVAVGYSDTSVLLWEVPAPSEPKPVAADELDRLWADLASADTAIAYRAIARLRADPKSAVELFRNRLRPVPKAASANVAALVADLDSPVFAKRETASAAIAKLGQDAVSALRSALANNPGPEHRERLEKALATLTEQITAPEDVRRLRALQVLEQIADAPSLAVLKTMSDGAGDAWVTQEAKESVSRLTKQPK